jgi:superfamily II DNA or RNA helicase
MTTTMSEGRTLEALADELRAWASGLLRRIDDLEGSVHADQSRLAEAMSGRVFDGAASERITQQLRLVRCGGSGEGPDVLGLLERVGARHAGRRATLSVASEARAVATMALDQLSTPRARSFFARATSPDRTQAVVALGQLRDWAERTGFEVALGRSASAAQGPEDSLAHGLHCIADALGVAAPDSVEVLAAADAVTLSGAWESGRNLTSSLDRLRENVRTCFSGVQHQMVQRQLEKFDIEILRSFIPPATRLQAVRDAGAHTVADLVALADRVDTISGLGVDNARALRAAAMRVRRTVLEESGTRFDANPNDRVTTSLVRSLWRLQSQYDATATVGPALEALAWDLEPIGPVLRAGEDVIVLHRTSPRRGNDVVRHLRERAAWLRTSGLDSNWIGAESSASDDVAWEDYRKRVVLYQGLLREVLGLEDDVEAQQGGLSAEVVAAVDRQRLDVSALSADLQSSLRGYQHFGARYALVQRRVLIGDEMGLGKTIQALAVMSHLSAQDADGFLVVCPPAVLTNWMREVRRHSSLPTYLLHGADRDQHLRRWRSRGGVAITTFDTLRKLDLDEVTPDLLVVDEAHLVKNPRALRTMAASEVGHRSDRVIFLTGTPLENKVEDFTNLLGMLQPNLVKNLDPALMVVGARQFRERVAPGYLRRRSEDVATELPPLVRTDEWVQFTGSEERDYQDAVSRGDFHDARRIAYLADPTSSSKLNRLEEIVDEAAANGRNVLVFSFYLDVINAVVNRLGDRVVGVITGQTPAADRQRVADQLENARVPSVLVSQVSAGGVGMNIQAASVVVLCEPQVKPSTEEQALKRAHRMGQLNSVQVHRLVTTDSVDERMLEILEQKAELFERFAAVSEVAQAAPEATDVNAAKLMRDVMAAEQQKWASGHVGGATARPPTSNLPVPEDEQPAPPTAAPAGAPRAERHAGPASASSIPPRPPVPHQISAETCPSCNAPIGPYGHCRCS